MLSKIDIIKKLRAAGASIRMMDDVAAYVGGYDNPVFMATVEFIIKLQNRLKTIGMAEEQEVGVDNQSLENVSFPAAKTAVQNDEDMQDDEKKLMLNHIQKMEAQKDSYMEQEPDKGEKPKDKKGLFGRSKKSKDAAKTRKNPVLDKLFKIANALDGTKNNQRLQRQQANLNMQHHEEGAAQNVQNVQRQAQKVAVQTQAQVSRKSSLRDNLMKIFKNTAVDKISSSDQAKFKQERRTIKESGKAAAESGNELAKAQAEARSGGGGKGAAEHQKAGGEGKATLDQVKQEVLSSVAIDKTIKDNKETQKPDDKKPGFTAKVEEKSGVKANSENVANLQEAITKLQNSGVKPSAAEPAPIKKEVIDPQLTQGGGASPQKQR